MNKTLIGIILFLVQIGLALFYNTTVDLVFVAGMAGIIFIYFLCKYFTGQYKQ